jgi:hypothetical protein
MYFYASDNNYYGSSGGDGYGDGYMGMASICKKQLTS